MSESEGHYLDLFHQWLKGLGQDASAMAAQLEAEASPAEAAPTEASPAHARAALAGGLTYLFKSLDLIPDGIDDIGYLDDAFVLRVAASLAYPSADADSNADAVANASAIPDALRPLVNDCVAIRSFLGDDYARLETYVEGLRRGAARGRSVEEVLTESSALADLVSDVRGFAQTYDPPAFSREARNLIKLRAFFDAKLPQRGG